MDPRDSRNQSEPRQINRRTLLRAGGASLFAATFLGCGGSAPAPPAAPAQAPASSSAAAPPPAAPAAASPAAGAAPSVASPAPAAAPAAASPAAAAPASGPRPRAGGNFSNYGAASPPGLDPYASGSQGQAEFSSFMYSRLYMLRSGPDVPAGSLAVTPDAAASSEVSADGLTYTIKLRDNVKFQPPLNRNMTAEDVVFSWERLNGRTPGSTPAGQLSNLTMIKSVEAKDASTVVFALKRPYPFFLQRLADPKAFFLVPKEMGSSFNPAEQAVGSGPWILTKYTPSSVAEFKRNPDWHLGPERPYFAQVSTSVVPEYATQLSQFLAGNIDRVTVQSADLRKVQQSVQGVQLYELPPFPLSVLNFSPRTAQFKDVRMRQAVSMALDRDAMLDAAYGLKELERQGVKVTRLWHNYVPASFPEYWLDPKGSEITPAAAAVFKYNPDRAKQLVQEAGGGFDTEFHYAAANSRYGEPYRIMSELVITYLKQIGINAKGVEEDYNSVFIPKTGQGDFDGMMWIPQTRTDPFAYFQTQYMNDTNPMYAQWKDDALIAKLVKLESTTNQDELRKGIRDIQNDLAEKAYVIPMQYGAATTYVAYQPTVQNATQYQTIGEGWATENLTHYWSNKA